METINLKLDDGERYDTLLAENREDNLPQASDVEIVTKPNATVGGQTGVMIAFYVAEGDDPTKLRRVQAVTTLRCMAGVAAALRGLQEREEAARRMN